MKLRTLIIPIVATCVLFSAVMAPAVNKKGTIPELKERLEKTTKPKDRVELAMVIVERQYDAADKAYAAGKTDEGQKDLADVEQYGVLAAQEAAKSRERMKKTEIALRKIEDRLDNLAKSVDLDYRAAVRDTLNKLEKARNALLMKMFK